LLSHIARLPLLLIAGSMLAVAAKPPIDCSKRPTGLADEVSRAVTNEAFTFTGVCSGPIVIPSNGVSITGLPGAAIDGLGQNGVFLDGVNGIKLTGFEVRGALNGILAVNGAHATLSSITSRNNFVHGIAFQTGSGGTLSVVTVSGNGVHGLDLETGSAVTINNVFYSTNNRVFGINANASSLTFARCIGNITGNTLGIQVATSGNAFLNDSITTLNISNNLSTGLTVVSGAHMVSFGGSIFANNNNVNGVSVNSKGGLDLDAGSTLTANNNGREGIILQEQSVMTVFNIPQFSGVPGFSTVNAANNTGAGVAVSSGSTLTLVSQARIFSAANASGLRADNGAGITLVNSALSGSTTGKDLSLTFGTRADIQSTTLATWTCDATVLVRGTAAITCPH
jgi:hypothetical protein